MSITIHHDGHGLNESIVIETDEPGPGNACHLYRFMIGGQAVGWLQYQLGPRNVEGSTPGLTSNAVIASLIHHLEGFQSGEFKNEETEEAIEFLKAAMLCIKERADKRAERGVLGTYNK